MVMIEYHRNNITFRIASSSALAKFKNMQANAFSQLTRQDIAFDSASKEVVLLEYDVFSKWLYGIEKYLLSADERTDVTDFLKREVFDSYKQNLLIIENIIEQHKDTFSDNVLEFTKLVHDYMTGFVKLAIAKKVNAIPAKAFGQIATILTCYLEHMLICMHEYNNNCVTKREHSFISLNDSCLHFRANEFNELEPLIQRINFFKKHYALNSFMFKDYRLKKSEFDDVPAKLSKLSKLGIKILHEEPLLC